MKNIKRYKGKHYKKIYKESWYKIIKQSIYLTIYPYIMKCVDWIDRFDNWYDNIDFKKICRQALKVEKKIQPIKLEHCGD